MDRKMHSSVATHTAGVAVWVVLVLCVTCSMLAGSCAVESTGAVTLVCLEMSFQAVPANCSAILSPVSLSWQV